MWHFMFGRIAGRSALDAAPSGGGGGGANDLTWSTASLEWASGTSLTWG